MGITLTMAVLVAKMVTATIMVVAVVGTLTVVVVVVVRIGRWGDLPGGNLEGQGSHLLDQAPLLLSGSVGGQGTPTAARHGGSDAPGLLITQEGENGHAERREVSEVIRIQD